MPQGILKDSGFLKKVFHLIAMVLFSIVLLSVFMLALTNGDINNVNTIKQMQLIQSLCLFVFVPVTLAYLWSEEPFNYLKLSGIPKNQDILLVIITVIVAIPAINLITYYNQQLVLPEFMSPIENWMKTSEKQLEELTLKILNVNTVNQLLFNVFLIALIPAIGEELFFRGIIQKVLSEKVNIIAAIWVSAFVFSAIHLQFYGFVPRMLLGAFLGYLVFWSDNLWLAVIAHFVNNGLAVVFYYLKFNRINVFDIDTVGTSNTIYIGIISLILTGFCVLQLRKQLIKNQASF